MKSLVIFLLFIHQLHGRVIDWPFVRESYTCYMNVSVGTPAQNLTISVRLSTYIPTLLLRNKQADPYGYDYRASSTFHYHGDAHNTINDTIGLNAKEDFIVNNIKLLYKPFALDEEEYFYNDEEGILSFAQPVDGVVSFVQGILTEFHDKVIVFSYDSTDLTTGIVSFGNRAPERCANDWVNIPQISPSSYEIGDQWQLKIDEFSFGKYTFDQPGSANFLLDLDESLTVPFTYKKQIEEAFLGPYYGACNSTVEFTFKFVEFVLHLTPKDYLGPPSSDGWCTSYIRIAEQYGGNKFDFGPMFFRNVCLSLDYKSTIVGFATRVFGS